MIQQQLSLKMKKQLGNEQITRIIQRENVITFKRKNEAKPPQKSQKEDDDDLVPSQPNEDNSFHKGVKKNMPLPEINRQKKRFQVRASESKQPSAYFQKQIRQRDNLLLKNANNSLANQNMKLKTKNMNLQKEILRLQKTFEEDPQKGLVNRQGRAIDSSTMKIVVKNLKKQLEQLKKQNTKIKTSVKFTTINELQVQRDAILEQSQRMREMLQQQRNRCNFLKSNQQSASQSQLKQLQEKNSILARENMELKSRSSKLGEDKDKNHRFQQYEKNISKQLLNARNTLKQKQKEIQYLKGQIKRLSSNQHNDSSLKVIQTHGLQGSKSRQIKSDISVKSQHKNAHIKPTKQKRLMSKSAQKYRTQQMIIQDKSDQCQSCNKLRQANKNLSLKIDAMKEQMDKIKSARNTAIDDFGKNPIRPPTSEEVDKVKRFLVHRFKAHHLSLDETVLHLLNVQDPKSLQTDISVGEFIEISMAQPFSILSDRYIEIFVLQICYKDTQNSDGVTIDSNKKIKKKILKQNFMKMLGKYQLLQQSKQDEMFIQIAQLVTHYQQHILKALNERRNSETTVQQKDFYDFFKEIELQLQYIDFMVSQIILESLDLQHLNIYNLFQIFFMPQQEVPNMQKAQKNQYKMIDTVVKEVDQEYQESKSFLQSKPKSINHRQQINHLQVDFPPKVGENEEEQYEQHFQEEGMNQANKKVQNQKKTFEVQIQNAQDEYIEDYEN